MTASPDVVIAIEQRLQSALPEIRDRLAQLVGFQSVHDSTEVPDGECARAAQYVADTLTDAGIQDVTQWTTSDNSIAVTGTLNGPEGAPTVLLYSHYDVQPAGDLELWTNDPWTLTERDGRWYGRGSADCKGNFVAQIAALDAVRYTLTDALITPTDSPQPRPLTTKLPMTIKFIVEGSEERGGAGLDDLIRQHPDLVTADVILINDVGNLAEGTPTLVTGLRGVAMVTVTVTTLAGEIHSGQYGGAAPDALAILINLLASLRDDEGLTTIDGLPTTQHWPGTPYPEDQFRYDAGILDGVQVPISASIADLVWARPAVTVIGMDVPSVTHAAAAIRPTASALLNLRVPPGMDADTAQQALVNHLTKRATLGAHVSVETGATGAPFTTSTDGEGYQRIINALASAYKTSPEQVAFSGQGGSIPLCNVLADINPDAEIALFGIEEPRCKIHAPDESVSPEELISTAAAIALLIASYRRES